MERVAVRVLENGKTIKTVTISRNVAESWVARQPKNYEIVAPPKIEVTKLQPIVQEQKKSAEVAPNVVNHEAEKTYVKNFDKVESKPKRGRKAKQ